MVQKIAGVIIKQDRRQPKVGSVLQIVTQGVAEFSNLNEKIKKEILDEIFKLFGQANDIRIVGKGFEFTSIQSALNSVGSSEGCSENVVVVMPGVYNENIDLKYNQKIFGYGYVEITGTVTMSEPSTIENVCLKNFNGHTEPSLQIESTFTGNERNFNVKNVYIITEITDTTMAMESVFVVSNTPQAVICENIEVVGEIEQNAGADYSLVRLINEESSAMYVQLTDSEFALLMDYQILTPTYKLLEQTTTSTGIIQCISNDCVFGLEVTPGSDAELICWSCEGTGLAVSKSNLYGIGAFEYTGAYGDIRVFDSDVNMQIESLGDSIKGAEAGPIPSDDSTPLVIANDDGTGFTKTFATSLTTTIPGALSATGTTEVLRNVKSVDSKRVETRATTIDYTGLSYLNLPDILVITADTQEVTLPVPSTDSQAQGKEILIAINASSGNTLTVNANGDNYTVTADTTGQGSIKAVNTGTLWLILGQ